ncbi:MAG: hypothetical protein CVU11_06410 [Bacteroidetes bacterium HGW-Bacteroidetes-6]|jgi:prepilin-type N-terminal cleavage/methylation domain-containing protein|nr:MAG: hypothetical protein CVU11_06410 [Bacteroidetes bacterium HGW-Bacteroidetes-6]
MKRYVDGFTIAELMTAMIISGILIAAASSAYLALRRQFITISETSEQTTSLYNLYNFTDDRFWSSDSVLYNCCDTITFYEQDSVTAKICTSQAGILLFLGTITDTIPIQNTQIDAQPYSSSSGTSFRVRSATIHGTMQKENIMLWMGK